MITANIKNAERYFCVNENFRNVFNFLKGLNKDTDSFDFEFEGFSGSVVALETKENSQNVSLEAHRRYLDIHYVIAGEEGFGYAPVYSLKPTTEYNEKDDYILFEGDLAKIVLNEGDFCIVYPEDAHAPTMFGKNTNKLKKVIVKIKID